MTTSELFITDEQIQHYTKHCGVSKPAAVRLIENNISSHNVENYLNAPLSELSDPFLLNDMNKAVTRIKKSLDSNEKILLFGDYDCDGVTSCALLYWVLSHYNAKCSYQISSREKDSYGLSADSAKEAIANNFKLLITMDCGMTSYAAAQAVKNSELDVIVSDHHTPGKQLPDFFALVNPRLNDELESIHNIAAVAVTFKLCHALIQILSKDKHYTTHPDLRCGLDFVALGSISDSVPLIGENRCFVKNGLKLINSRPRISIMSLLKKSGLTHNIQVEHLSKRVIPKINAAGRVGDPVIALKLLITESTEEANDYINQLEKFNKKRQNIEESIYKQALKKAKKVSLETPLLIIDGENWEPGVIGLITSKLAREFKKPTIVLSLENGEYLGSARSINNLDLLNAVKYCDQYLESYGGHPMAFGLQFTEKNLHLFKEKILKTVSENPVYIKSQNKKHQATEISLKDFTCNYFEEFERFLPYGRGCKPTLYKIRNIELIKTERYMKKNSCGKVKCPQSYELSFTAFDIHLKNLPKNKCTILCNASVNKNKEIILFIKDIVNYDS